VNVPFVAVPEEVVTVTFPVAPVPTIAVMVVAFTKLKEEASTSPNLTESAPVKFVPVIVMVVPVVPDAGEKLAMIGTLLLPLLLSFLQELKRVKTEIPNIIIDELTFVFSSICFCI